MQVRSIAHQEEEEVFFWLLREFGWSARTKFTLFFGPQHTLFQAPEIVVLGSRPPFGLLLFLRLIFTQQQIVIDVLLNGEGSIEVVLNSIFAVIEFVFGDALGIDADFIDH